MGQARLTTKSDMPHVAPDWSIFRESLTQPALALTRSHSDADDLIQQTLLALLAKRDEGVWHVGYVRRTMFRLWLDQRRSLRRRLRRLAGLATTVRPWHTDPDELMDRDQTDRVHRAIERLPPHQHAAVVLRLIEGLGYAEIADTLGCSIETVRANLHLGRRRIRRLLGESK